MEDKIYIFARYEDNWADEMDIDKCGATAFTKEEYEGFLKDIETIKNYTGKVSFGIGTNESMEYDCGEDFVSALDIQTISRVEYSVLKKFGFAEENSAIDLVDRVMENIGWYMSHKD